MNAKSLSSMYRSFKRCPESCKKCCLYNFSSFTGVVHRVSYYSVEYNVFKLYCPVSPSQFFANQRTSPVYAEMMKVKKAAIEVLIDDSQLKHCGFNGGGWFHFGDSPDTLVYSRLRAHTYVN